MDKVTILLMALLLTACGRAKHNGPLVIEADAAYACQIKIGHDYIADKYGLEEIPAHVSIVDKVADNEDGSDAQGRYFSTGHIELEINEEDPTTNCLLAGHEFNHAALHITEGHFDKHHEDESWNLSSLVWHCYRTVKRC